ncbi:hypothetical protein [Teredinibacter turnerae]|uniref:Uncharacterized protein n=1 Tax=Teredinibacter turnerae (strain ATCC 39867 / T7901) TaxID=377629 RepID=C5BRF5_TERTT|nr:hypothetical protein [Teredinibacter turnerae]ACR12363.1 conserved hypothetical protein [Teredinibacter turnerae T7901]
MNKAKTAALYSAFIFPGAGQVWLKCWLTGVPFILGTVWAIYLLLDVVFSIAFKVVDQIQSGQVSLNPLSIREAISYEIAHTSGLLTSMPMIILVGLWLLSIADAYRVGRTKDKQSAE